MHAWRVDSAAGENGSIVRGKQSKLVSILCLGLARIVAAEVLLSDQ